MEIDEFCLLSPQLNKEGKIMNWRTSIKSLLISSITLLLSPVATQAIPIEEIEEIAEKITVQIISPGENGSGVIIGQKDNTYYVLTAQHVVESIRSGDEADFKTYDEELHFMNTSKNEIIRFPDQIDLAVVSFESEKDYPAATLSGHQYQIYKNRDYRNDNYSGNNSLNQDEQYVFVSGYPLADVKNSESNYIFNPGILFDNTGSAVSNPAVTNPEENFVGYEMLYTNLTHPGVSGGAVLDASGRLIAIHGRADGKKIDDNNQIIQQYLNEFGEPVQIKVGLSLGIPIQTFFDWYEQQNHDWNLQINRDRPTELSLSDLEQWQPELPTEDEGNIFYWLSLANQKWRLNQTEEAIKAFDRAIALQEDWVFPWFAKGFALGFNQQYEQAAQACAEATRLERNSYDAFRCQAGARQELGEFEAALTALNSAMEINPNNYADYSIKGELLFAMGQLAGSLEAFQEAIDLRSEQGLPPSAILLANKSFVLINKGDYQLALDTVEKALNINKDYAPAWSNKGFILRELGEHSKALEAYNRATELAPNNATIWNNKGLTLFEMERYDEAMQAFDEAIAIDENFQAAQENRDYLLEMMD